VPHVNIKHFPVRLTAEKESALVSAITEAVQEAFDCPEGVVSIAVEPVAPEVWTEQVYTPEIVDRGHLLRKPPDY
jgi:phenylpyruvate tautomerase PptA (4-oxalocrotonate tautomerase family)